MEHKSSYVFLFPEDIERLIFEQAAEDDKRTALQLVLVARRVQQWIEPIVYRVITMHCNTFRPHPKEHPFLLALDSTPKHSEFYTRHVKGFWSSGLQSDDVLRILTLCSGVTIIYSWFDWTRDDVDMLDTAIGRLRPQRFTIFENTFGTAKPDFHHAWFSNMTHLSIAVDWNYWASSALDIIPHLTHIGLRLELHSRSKQSAILADVLRILSCCKALRVCLFGETDRYWEEDFDHDGRSSGLVDASQTLGQIDDPRIVLHEYRPSLADWESFWAGKPDKWSRAEAHVERRRESMKRGVKVGLRW